MTAIRRGDPAYRYAKFAKELNAGVSVERARYIHRELDDLWWGMSEEQRRAAPQAKGRAPVVEPEPEAIEEAEPES